jgi:hypothetical protein
VVSELRRAQTGRSRSLEEAALKSCVEFLVFWHRRLAIIAKGAPALDTRSRGALIK